MYHTSYIPNTLDSYFGVSARGFSVIDWVHQNLQRELTLFINNPLFDLPANQVWQPIFFDQEPRNNNYNEANATKMIVDFICLIPGCRKTDFSNNIVAMAEKCNNLIYSFGEEVRKDILVKTLEYIKKTEKIIPILEYLTEISKYYKLNYNIPDTPTLYYSRFSEGEKKGQLKEQDDKLFKEHLRNFQHITTRHLVPTTNYHIEDCFSTILENIITLVKTNFIPDVSNNTDIKDISTEELVEDTNANAEMSKIVSEETVVNTPDYGPHGEDDPENWRGATDEHLAELAELCKMVDSPKKSLEDQYSSLDKSLYSCVVSTIPEFKRFQLLFLDKKNMALSLDFFDTITGLYKQCGIDHQFKYINNPDNIINSETFGKFKQLFESEFYNESLTIDSLVEDLKHFYKIMELEKRYGKTIIQQSQKKEYDSVALYNGCRTCGAMCYCKEGNQRRIAIDELLVDYRKIKSNCDFSSDVQPMSEFNIGSWINEADSVLETRDNYGYLAEQWKEDRANSNSYKSVHIFFINSSSQTIVCTNLLEDIVRFIQTYLKDFQEIVYLDTMGQNIIDKIEEFFHIKEFDNLDEAKEKYNSFSTLYNLSNNTKDSHNEKNMILGYIQSNYNLSKDPAKRMKASVIQKEIESALREFIPRDLPDMSRNSNGKDSKDFSKRISSYLLELDLNKKRFSDGIYYYGIEPKKHDESYEEKLASHKVLPLPPLQPVKYH